MIVMVAGNLPRCLLLVLFDTLSEYLWVDFWRLWLLWNIPMIMTVPVVVRMAIRNIIMVVVVMAVAMTMAVMVMILATQPGRRFLIFQETLSK